MGDYTEKFQFRDTKKKTSSVLYRVHSKRLDKGFFQISTGEVLEVKKTKGDIKSGQIEKSLTPRLRMVKSLFSDLFGSYPQNDTIKVSELKEKLKVMLNPETEKPKNKLPSLIEFIKSEIDQPTLINGKSPSEGTIKNWQSLLSNLIWYGKPTGFNDISQKFLDGFSTWVQNEHKIISTYKHNEGEGMVVSGRASSTRGRLIKDLKKFMALAESVEHNYEVRQSYKGYSAAKENSKDFNGVYLTLEDQKAISRLILPARLDERRDWLLIACQTGQRFSDWVKIQSTEEEELDIIQQKTGANATIPISGTVRRIWSNDDREMIVSSMNGTIKGFRTICELAGIDEKIEVEHRDDKGKVIKTEIKKKYELIGTHIGRYSFITNAIDGGMPTHLIMSITGHYNEKVMANYFKKRSKEVAQQALKFEMLSQVI